MAKRPPFAVPQAQELAAAFRASRADYLFIGRGGAILLGYPATTQDMDLFLPKDRANAVRVIKALRRIGFKLDAKTRQAILDGKDFVQIKSGRFDVDLIHAPDGIPNFVTAKARSIRYRGFRIASLNDIIASKRASARQRDMVELPLLEEFRKEFTRAQSRRLRTGAQIAKGKK